MTVYSIRAPQSKASRPYIVTGRTDEVLQNLRAGTRPPLAGLTPEMDAAFRSGRLVIFRPDERILPERVNLGGSTLIKAYWEEFGLPKEPNREQKELAAAAYEQYRKAEAFAPAENESAAFAAVQTGFRSDFGRFGLSLLYPQTAEEVVHVGHLLQLFAADVLPPGLIKTIDFNYHGFDGIRTVKYESNNKTLRLVNPGNRWDRYLYTKIFLTGLGYAAFYTLSLPERNTFNELYDACRQKGACLAADPTGRAPGEQIVSPSLWDFFAGNFMQFHLLGEGMIDRSPNWQLRAQLQDFYRDHFSTVVA